MGVKRLERLGNTLFLVMNEGYGTFKFKWRQSFAKGEGSFWKTWLGKNMGSVILVGGAEIMGWIGRTQLCRFELVQVAHLKDGSNYLGSCIGMMYYERIDLSRFNFQIFLLFRMTHFKKQLFKRLCLGLVVKATSVQNS